MAGTVQVHPAYMNPVFCADEDDEGFSDEGPGPGLGPCTNIIADDSTVEIGNKVEFNGGVVILPGRGHQVPAATAEQVFNGLQTGKVKAKNIDVEFKGKKKRRWLFTKFAVLGVIAIVGTILLVFVFTRKKMNCEDFVSRGDWEADPCTCKIDRYEKLPILVLVYQTEKKNCQSCTECADQVKGLQKYQQKPRTRFARATVRPEPACDIQYNFLVGGDGRIYEGRGYQLRGGMPDSFDNQTLILAFMGNFIVSHPDDRQLAAAEKFLESAAAQGHLDPDYRIAGAMQVRRSDSPGCALQSDLALWPRWTDKPLKLLGTSRRRNETYEDLCRRTPPPPLP